MWDVESLGSFLNRRELLPLVEKSHGSYKVYFHNLPDESEELYAGEAMLALLETYRQTGDSKYLQSAEHGFRYYDAKYFGTGRVGKDVLVFFANWQSQACRLLFEHASDTSLKQDVARYIYRMHDRISACPWTNGRRGSTSPDMPLAL